MASPNGSPSRSYTSLLAPNASSSSTRGNPISLRIYKAIGTSFDDPSSGEALETASAFYSTGEGKQWAEGEAAATLARKHLKRDVEHKLAESSQSFLQAFGEVDKKLDVLRAHMLDMETRCNLVQTELDKAHAGTSYLLEKADGLRSQRSVAHERSQIIEVFLSRFTLSEAEATALAGRELAVGPELFAALDRVLGIRKDCRVLLGGEEGTTQAGMDIMAATSQQLEAGYNKIHRWCQFEFRHYTRDAQLEVSDVMREAILRLRDRPALLQDALQTLTSTRQASVLNSFLDALTRGGPNGLPRPIELHAHDPTRYVGDMLAWVHQATASEHEFLDQLFGVKDSKRMVGSARSLVGWEEMARESLDRDLEGVCRPLKIRIQHTIKSQEGIIMAFKIANLLQFYLVTMRKTIGEGALLSTALAEIHTLANAAFFETLDAQGRSLLRFLHPPDASLAPPPALRDTAQILREIIGVYDSSLVDESERETDFARLLESAVDPAVEMCKRMGELRKGSTSWEKDLFLVNCLLYLEHVLEAYSFTAPRVALLEEQIQGHVQSLTDEHYGKLLEQCGLLPIVAAIDDQPADTPLSRLPATSSKQVSAALATFSSFLASIDVLSSPRLALLQSPKLATQIHRTALERISEGYSRIYDAVLDKVNGFEFAETLLRRGKDEVAVALGVEV